MTDQEWRREANRRKWKNSIKAMVPQMICCGDPDCMIVGETKRDITIMCGECQGITVISEPS